ncbi:MAG: acyl-CoA thioesterase [Verrucomicrobiota bacterium]
MSEEDNNDPIFRYVFTVPESALDENRHVNNVVYVQWMQDVATLHFQSRVGEKAMQATGPTWFARSHQIEYLKPAFAGDSVVALTWPASYRRVRCFRHYQFLRASDNELLAQGETDWVYVDGITGKPKRIPNDITSRIPSVDVKDKADFHTTSKT